MKGLSKMRTPCSLNVDKMLGKVWDARQWLSRGPEGVGRDGTDMRRGGCHPREAVLPSDPRPPAEGPGSARRLREKTVMATQLL